MPRLSAVGISGIHAGEDVKALAIACWILCWIAWKQELRDRAKKKPLKP